MAQTDEVYLATAAHEAMGLPLLGGALVYVVTPSRESALIQIESEPRPPIPQRPLQIGEQYRSNRSGELLFRAVFVVLDELPHETRAFLRVDAEHSELDEFIRHYLASPRGSDNLASVVFLEVDFPTRFELEVANIESGGGTHLPP